jgi:phospholipid/cholesterol/gamma-HCH transport system substrate-binding protein
MRSFSTELKVGTFALVVMAVVAFMTFQVKGFNWLKREGYTVYVYFNNIAGLDRKTKVRIAGVDSGVIEKITLEGNRAKIKIRMYEGVRLYSDGSALIKMAGFLGDKFLEVRPGSKMPLLKDGDSIPNTIEVTDVDGLIRNFSKLSKDISGLTASIDELVGSEESKRSLKETITNLRDISQNVNMAVAYNDKKLRKVLDNIDELSDSLDELLDTNRELFNKTVSNLNEFSGQLKGDGPAILKKINKTAEDLNKLIEENRPALKRSIERLDKVSEKFTADDGLYESAQKTISETRELVDSAKKTWPVRSYIKEPKEKTLKVDSYE